MFSLFLYILLMPGTKPRLKEQRALAANMFMQGIRPGVIAEQLGVPYNTIQTWRTRDNWVNKQSDLNGELAKANYKLAAEKLAEQSMLVRDRLASDILASLDALPALRRDNIRHWLSRMKGIETIVNNASKVFGWNDSSNKGSALVRIDLSTVKQIEPVTVDCTSASTPQDTESQ